MGHRQCDEADVSRIAGRRRTSDPIKVAIAMAAPATITVRRDRVDGLLCLPTGEKKARATSRKRWNRILIPFHFPASSANQANHSIVNSSLPRSFVGPRQLLSLGGPRERDNQPEPATSHQTKVRLVSFLPSQKSHASEVQDFKSI